MPVRDARFAAGHPDRSIELEEQFDGVISDLIAQAVIAGYTTEEAVAALKSAAWHFDLALAANKKTNADIRRALVRQ